MTEEGSDRESESPNNRLVWNGIQYLPASQVAEELEAGSQVTSVEPDPLLAVLAFVVGFLIFLTSTSLILALPKDMAGDTITGAFGAVGVGLMIFCPLELARIRPLPKRMRDWNLKDKLAHTLGFTAAELALNRRGQLSIMQRLRLIGVDLGWWLTVLACAGLVVLPLLLAGGLRDPVKDIQVLLFVALGLYALWRASSTLVDAVRGHVRMEVTGLRRIVQPRNWASELVKNWTDSTVYYAYQGKDGLQFGVSRAAYEALMPGEQYRVYVTPLSSRLMSVEPAGV